MSYPAVERPSSLDQLLAAMQRRPEKTMYLAGGTDLMIKLRDGGCAPQLLIDLSGLGPLRGVEHGGETSTLGAMVTFGQLERDPLLCRQAACLYQAAGQVGSAQIRNMATVGGNIANGGPAADGATALLALGAELKLLAPDGEARWQPLEEYLQAPARPKALITKIRIPHTGSNAQSAFAKVGSRSSVTISQLILAAALWLEPDGATIRRARVALGAVGRHPFLDEETMNWLEDRALGEICSEEWCRRLAQTVEAAIPGRPSVAYKRVAIKGLGLDVFDQLFAGPAVAKTTGG